MRRCDCAAGCCCRARCSCQLAPLVRLLELLSDLDRDSESWWRQVRKARDEVLEVLRAGPPEHVLDASDRQFWADYLATVERVSAKLDRDFWYFTACAYSMGISGTA
jgi:hypothetical protein